MGIPFLDAFGAAANLIDNVVDKVWPNPADKAKAEATVIQAAANAALANLQQQMSVMLAEAQSTDKWTSRARPSFLYVMYCMILICIPFGILWAFSPEIAERMAKGMQMWLGAIPDGLWATFGIGYSGYAMSRSYEKGKGVAQ
jgi:preprotein translocase subunit SecY